MKIRAFSNFRILSLILGIIIIFSFPNNDGNARYSLQVSANSIYLPVIVYKFPLQTVFGVAMDRIDSSQGLDLLTNAGMNWTRRGFIWGNIESLKGQRNWDSNVEKELLIAARWNIHTIMIIDGTPDWAVKTGFTCGAVKESEFPALGQFAYDLVKRYSAAPYNVHNWELWNEPDAAGLLGCWGDPSDTQYYGGYYYGQMLQAVYPQIKAADPQAQVLVGGLLLDCDPVNAPEGSCIPSKFLNGILESGKVSGGGPYFDGVAFHAYDYYTGNGSYANPNWHSTSSTTGPVSIAKAEYLRGVLAQYDYGDRYLINTETALFWGPNVMDPPCRADEPPDMEATKVNYLIQSYAAAVAEGWKASIWYSVIGVRCSGLLKSDLRPNPAYFAFQFTEQKLGKAVFVRKITEYDQMLGYEFETTGRRLWVVWSLDGQARTINLPGQPLEVNRVGEDGLAVQETNALTLTLGLSPVFVEFNN